MWQERTVSSVGSDDPAEMVETEDTSVRVVSAVPLWPASTSSLWLLHMLTGTTSLCREDLSISRQHDLLRVWWFEVEVKL